MEQILSAKDLLKSKDQPREKEASYIELSPSAYSEHGEYTQSGESCRIDALKDVFAWMPGFVNAFYGWANDGKGTFTDYLMVLKAKIDGKKFCVFKQEDMDTTFVDGKPKIRANRIYKNLAWTYSGKTWSRNFAEKWQAPMMTLVELQEALEFVTEHFYVIYPEDRKYKAILDEFAYMYEKYGIYGFMLDPWNTVILDDNKRGDQQLVDAFIDTKEFAMKTNSVFNIISHPRSMHDVKEKDGKYKVVNQFMQLGGSAWDIKMDMQLSIYRPERHINPTDPKAHFYNLKTRQAEIVGVNKGSFEGIEFDFKKKRYYFDGVDVIDGTLKEPKFKQGNAFESNSGNDDTPF